MRIRTLRGTPVSFPIRPYPPASHPCADLYWYIQTALPLFHPSSNPFLSRSAPSFSPAPLIHTSLLPYHPPLPLLESTVPLLDLRCRSRPHPEILRLLNISRLPSPAFFSHASMCFVCILLPADAQRPSQVATWRCSLPPWRRRKLSVSISNSCAQQ
jgi:hypothetical protein